MSFFHFFVLSLKQYAFVNRFTGTTITISDAVVTNYPTHVYQYFE